MTIPEYYTTHFSQYHEKTFTIDPAPFLSAFAENLKPGAHVLDIGCGSGRDLLWLAQKGLQPTGFEASPGLAPSPARTPTARSSKVILNPLTLDWTDADVAVVKIYLDHAPRNP